MLDWDSEVTAALEQVRKNGYLVVDESQGDREESLDRVLITWAEECGETDQPYVQVKLGGPYARIELDLKRVPYQLRPNGVDHLYHLVNLHREAEYEDGWFACTVPIEKMPSVACEMIAIVKDYGDPPFSLDRFEELYRSEQPSTDQSPIFSWSDHALPPQWYCGPPAESDQQSLDEMAKRGYTITIDNRDAFGSWRLHCIEQSLPLVAACFSSWSVVCKRNLVALYIDMTTTRKRLTPEGRSRASELLLRHMDVDAKVVLVGGEMVSCDALPVECVDEIAHELFTIGKIYVSEVTDSF